MIKYKLACKNCNLTFDSWFATSNEYEKLKKKKLLNCHNCNSREVDKTVMSPKIINYGFNEKLKEKSQNIKNIKKTLQEYQKFIKNNFKYVGKNFAYEARSIHYNDKKEQKGIYGSASKKDLKELKEEGIDAQIIPWVENKSN